ncbi:hypothetical protein M3Y94_01054400 [Aphelenchoides besseyi]|nr:hypothetical protein M3Y94_01054400 [Aphelenchoides besseyi]KAI6224123.1 hypothetical protein M3Y95_00850000 [Aphelenchoides besseyi]
MHVRSSVFLFLAFMVFLIQVSISVFTITQWIDMKHSKLSSPQERTRRIVGLVLMFVSLVYNASVGSMMQKCARKTGFFAHYQSEKIQRKIFTIATSLLGIWMLLFLLSLIFAYEYLSNIGVLLFTNAVVTGILLLHLRALRIERGSDVPSIKSGQSTSSITFAHP